MRLFIFLFLVINFLGVIFLGYLYFTEKNIWWVIGAVPQTPRRAVEAVLDRIVDSPYILYDFKDAGLPVYNIEIDDKKYDQLVDNLPKLIGEFLQDKYKKSKKAVFRYGNKEYEANVRFRGDGSGHWFWEKRSWRIGFEDSDLFQGYNAINLIAPNNRQLITEYLSNYRARKLGLTVPDDDWAVLYVNGKKHGVYYQTEQWGEEFLERHQLSSDTNFYGDKNPPSPLDPFDIYKEFGEVTDKWRGYTKNTDENRADLSKFIGLLQSDDEYFFKHIWDIVDEDNFYRWYIHSQLMSSIAQESMHNVRLYFNKDIGKFQFIPVNVIIADSSPLPYFFIGYHPLLERLLLQDDFLEEMERRLWHYVSNEDNLKEDLEFYDSAWQRVRIAFYHDRFDEMSSRFLDNWSMELRDSIERIFYDIKEKIQKYTVNSVITLSKKKSIATIELFAKSNAPIAFNGLQIKNYDQTNNKSLLIYEDSDNSKFFDIGDRFLGYLKKDDGQYRIESLNEVFYPNLTALDKEEYVGIGDLELLARVIYEPMFTTKRYFIAGLSVNNDSRLKVKFFIKNTVTGEDVQINNTEYINGDTFSDFEKLSKTTDEIVRDYYFLVKRGDRQLYIPSGTYVITKDVIIPRGVSLEIAAGARLLFAPGISFVSYGDVQANGSPNYPIEFTSQLYDPWGVFAVVQAKGESTFDYVHFSNGSEANINGASFTGMLALHHSDAMIRHSTFTQANGDDALNIKNASSTVFASSFFNNNADAIDFDYMTGSIIGNIIKNDGNDGIDISGSDILISDNFISKSGDKCISIGEKSEKPIIFNNVLDNCKIGIETKDGSTPRIISNIVVNNEIGLNAYRKKEIFVDGGKAKVYNSIIWGNDVEVQDDKFSKTKIYYSDVEGGYEGEGNIFVDPVISSWNIRKVSKNEALQNIGNIDMISDILEDILNIDIVPIGLMRDIK